MRKNNRGFTIIEMLVYMGLLSIFLIILTNMLVSVLDLRNSSEGAASVENDARFILARLAYDNNRASSTTVNGNGSLTLVISGANYTYSISNGKLLLTDNVGTDQVEDFDTSISNLSFQKIQNSDFSDATIEVQFTLTGKTTAKSGAVQSKTFQTSLGRRQRP